MPNNGTINVTIDGLEVQSATIAAGYTSGGTVKLDNTINSVADTQAAKIAEILALLETKKAPSANISLQEKTVTPSTSTQTVMPDASYNGLSKVIVNAMTTATQATPSINVSSSGLITASATQTAGYVSAGTKSATKQLTTQAAQTITPGTSDKTISSGRYLTGTQTVKGDSNLIASNIKSGVSIFGVSGSYEGSGGGSSGSGGGGEIEMCQITLTVDAPNATPFTVSHMDANLEIITTELNARNGGVFNVAKNTIFTIAPWHQMGSDGSGGVITKLFGYPAGAAFIAAGDGTLRYRG